MQTILLGSLLDCQDDPEVKGIEAMRFIEDGALLIEHGLIAARGERQAILNQATPQAEVKDYSGKWIAPGFIDTHIHFPQTEMIAAYGEHLLSWLTEHAFPEEEKFYSRTHAQRIADVFLNELLRNGTTTALVFGTVHPQSVDALFESAQQKNLRMIAGKVLMDRNCPESLQESAQTGYDETKTLIEKWHGVDRLLYAVTPRFAPTSTPEQLRRCAQLLQEYPTTYMHTHVSENADECAWVADLFPQSKDYVGVYQDAGLLRRRSVLAHGIHLSDRELNTLSEHDCAIAHCPTSNLFIGSGLFNLRRVKSFGIPVGMATDIGAGTSFSMLQTYNEAYKVQQLQHQKLSAFEGLYMATLGGARALDLEGKIGQLEPGCEADVIVMDLAATPLLEFRLSHAKTLHDRLFALMILADDRAIYETYAAGQSVHRRDAKT